MAEIISIAVGFILTTLAGGWWASRLQQRSWERQNQIRLKEEETRRASDVSDELSRLLDKRLYRMGRLYWALVGLQRGDTAPAEVELRLQDYNVVLYEWNDRLNANLAQVGSHFGSAARQYLFNLYEHFRRVGSNLEEAVRSFRRNEDVSGALQVLHPEFEGWSDESLNGRVYTLGLALATQLRDGLVGQSAPERQRSPVLLGEASRGMDETIRD